MELAIQPPHSANRHDADCRAVGRGDLGGKIIATTYERSMKWSNWRQKEIPQSANRVVGILGLGLRSADCAVGAELLLARPHISARTTPLCIGERFNIL